MANRRIVASLSNNVQTLGGSTGDTLYSRGDGSALFDAEPLVSPVRIIDSPDELSAEKLIVPNLATIYNSWDRVGMTAYVSGTNPPVNEQQGWTVTNGVVSSSINSAGPIGFMTPDRYEDYDLEVTISSTNGDDDTTGVILASVYRDNAMYILTAERSPGDVGVTGGATWSVVVSKITATTMARALVLNKSLPIAFGNGGFGNNRTESGYVSNSGLGWDKFPNGTRIKVHREGSTITLRTTQLNSADYVPAADITLDLTTVYNGWFNTSSPFGLMAYSQPATTFNILNITVNDNYIYDATNGNVWEYASGAWAIGAEKGYDNLKVGHMYYNPNTLRHFFYPRKGVIRALTKS